MKACWADPAFRAARTAAMNTPKARAKRDESFYKPELRRQRREAMEAKWRDPAYREMIVPKFRGPRTKKFPDALDAGEGRDEHEHTRSDPTLIAPH